MADFDSNLVVHLPLNESAGNPVDLMGNTSPVKYGGATYVAGKSGNGMQLDGVDGHIYLPHVPAINDLTELTVAFWVYLTSWPNALITLASKQNGLDNGTYPTWDLRKTGPADTIDLYVVCDEEGTLVGYNIVSAASLATGAWMHVAFTYDMAYLRLYINGSQSGAPVPTNGYGFHPADVNIAFGTNPTYPNGRYVTGILDDIRIYDRALTDADLAALAAYVPTAPSITGGATQNISRQEGLVTGELVTFEVTGEPLPTMSIVGGADADLFQIYGGGDSPALVPIAEDFAFDYANPVDVGGNNVYDVVVRVSSYMGTYDQTIHLTITERPESNGSAYNFLLCRS